MRVEGAIRMARLRRESGHRSAQVTAGVITTDSRQCHAGTNMCANHRISHFFHPFDTGNLWVKSTVFPFGQTSLITDEMSFSFLA